MVHALLPLKDLVEAKSRLSGVLRPSERRALAQAMVEDVLAVLAAHPQVTGITLLSDDPGAHLLAASYGACHLPETSLGCRGLNPVVARCAELLRADGVQRLLVLHGDLPLLGTADISAALELQRKQGGLVIATDSIGEGTNIMVFDTANTPDFRFGEGSCAAHAAWAEDQGLPATVLRRPGTALDVDEVADLAQLLAAETLDALGRTAGLLQQWSGSRIAAALGSLEGEEIEMQRNTAKQ